MPSEFQYDVFLSHSAKDKAVVRAVAERLRADKVRVWFDEWEIKPGDSIPAKIEEGLNKGRMRLLPPFRTCSFNLCSQKRREETAASPLLSKSCSPSFRTTLLPKNSEQRSSRCARWNGCLRNEYGAGQSSEHRR